MKAPFCERVVIREYINSFGYCKRNKKPDWDKRHLAESQLRYLDGFPWEIRGTSYFFYHCLGIQL